MSWLHRLAVAVQETLRKAAEPTYRPALRDAAAAREQLRRELDRLDDETTRVITKRNPTLDLHDLDKTAGGHGGG